LDAGLVYTCTTSLEDQPNMKSNTGKHDKYNKRIAKAMRWARRKTDEELTAFILEFPKLAIKLVQYMRTGEYDGNEIKNLRVIIAFRTLNLRRQGRETYSPRR